MPVAARNNAARLNASNRIRAKRRPDTERLTSSSRLGGGSGSRGHYVRALALHLEPGPEDRTPLSVIVQGHSAFDADPHPLFRFLTPAQKLLQYRHELILRDTRDAS